MDSKDRFPLLRKILKAIGLPDEAIDDIVERILDWLSVKDQTSGTPTELPFKLRDDFLSTAEVSFCQVLRNAVGDRAVICPKVNLGDLFFAATGDRRKNRGLANRVDRKHVDFLLCEPKIMRPVLGVELDDRSHDRADRQARDQLVEAVFNAAGLPLLRFAVKAGYAPAEIESQVMRHFGHKSPAVKSPSAPAVPVSAPSDSAPACPKCGSKMILRTAKSGENAGGQFWGCSNFPKCRSVSTLKQFPTPHSERSESPNKQGSVS